MKSKKIILFVVAGVVVMAALLGIIFREKIEQWNIERNLRGNTAAAEKYQEVIGKEVLYNITFVSATNHKLIDAVM